LKCRCSATASGCRRSATGTAACSGAADPGGTGGDIPADPDDCSCTECDGSCLVGDYDLDLDDDPDFNDRGHRDDEPDGGTDPHDPGGSDDDGGSGPGPNSGGPGPGAPSAGQARQRRPADLIVPLATLLRLAERPGEIHGFGLLDPALARELAAAAAASPRAEVCVTVTSPEGYAIGHGCARPARPGRAPRQASLAASLITLPARLNVTIPVTTLPSLADPASRAGPEPHAGPGSHTGTGGHAGPDSHSDSWAFRPRR